MERCDFCSSINIIRRYISEDRNMNQIDLLYEVFESFLNDPMSDDFDFDNGQVCRWFNGQARISPRISGFYMDICNKKSMAVDIERNVLPIMYDSAMAVQEIYNTLVQDTTISDKIKMQLSRYYPRTAEESGAEFFAEVLCFGMERNFVKRDTNTKLLLAAGTLSPIVKEFVFDSDVPKPCRHFCGRDNELSDLHELLCRSGKVFLHGIAGIGKSELAKAYAKRYGKEYTNILYIHYSGDLKEDIIDMDFADDLTEDSSEERFRKHNRFLRTLKEDTLLIIDNFNTTAIQEGLLSVALKYRCRIIFTTRSRFENYTYMNLEEIADSETLMNLMGYFFSAADKYRPILEQVIHTVHSHTLAVELAARLLETGILEPQELLDKLKEEKAGMDATDTIGITKDGKSRRATYYDHIHTLFALYQLSDVENNFMRNLALVPVTGISNRLFAKWLKLRDMNTINDLVEKGFVESLPGRMIVLHPMLREVAIEETKPSIKNCNILLDSLREICLLHGMDVIYYGQMFRLIESIIGHAEKDDISAYLRFLEDAYTYMDKYSYAHGMDMVLNELTEVLKDDSVGTDSDRALLLDYRASREINLEKAIRLEEEALSKITEITPVNALLVSNIYSNLGSLYHRIGNLGLAKQHMEQGIMLLKRYRHEALHDGIVQITNYGVLLADMGQPQEGLAALQKLCKVIREYNSDHTLDYACVQEAMGNICVTMGEVKKATKYFKKALAIYEVQFEAEPEVIEEKKQEFLLYTQTGLYFGKQFLGKK